MHMTFGFLQVTLKYSYRRGNTIIYQRAIPTDLRTRYSGANVKHDLKTSDISIAEKAIAALSKRYETEWAGLRSAPDSSPASLKVHADAFLKESGLIPGSAHNDPFALDLLNDHIDATLGRLPASY